MMQKDGMGTGGWSRGKGYLWPIHIVVQQKPIQHCKAIILQFKIELDCKEGWASENWCFRFVVLKKTLESPLDCKEIKPVNPKRNQPWIFIGRTDAEAEAPILWLPKVKSRPIRKDPDAGKDWRQEEKSAIEDETGWMASSTQWTWVWANLGREWSTGKPGVLQSMGSHKESDTTERTNNKIYMPAVNNTD